MMMMMMMIIIIIIIIIINIPLYDTFLESKHQF